MVSDQALVSILMPVKDVSKYIVECIFSIQNQSYEHWELIVVDDNSSDQTWNILNGFIATDKRVKIFKNEGQGIIAALNLAFSHSSGQYISRMDGDDIMDECKLEVLVAQLSSSGKGFLSVGRVQYFSDSELGAGYLKYEKWLNALISTGELWSEIYKECVVPSPCWMVHRSDLELAGAFRSERYPEDYDLCFRFYKAGLIPIPCDRILHYWRDYPERTSRTNPLYADNRFLEIKSKYFLEIDYQTTNDLILWGAGKKAKAIALILNSSGISFHWISNNKNKIGQRIYSNYIQHESLINDYPNSKIIIAVANEIDQKYIKKTLLKSGFSNLEKQFFFC